MKRTIIQGILYDEKSSYLRGSGKAPNAIREAFHSNSTNYYSESGLEISSNHLIDEGNFKIGNYQDIYTITKEHLLKNDAAILTLGGDHSITYPVIKALSEIRGPFHVLHIDAHADLYDDFEGDKYSHACPFARIMESELISSLTQVGIRTLNTHQRAQAQRFGVITHEMKDWGSMKLNIKEPLYISLDMDAFDPAFAPGVSHHEPGGLTSRQVIDIILSLEAEVIGADIVEYNPDRDNQNITAALAAKMMKEIIAKIIG
jgi:agmatinase